MIKPTDARANAPVIRFASGDSLGRVEEDADALALAVAGLFDPSPMTSASACANLVLRMFKDVKYKALPTLVRIVLGSVPRHSCLIGLGPAAIALMDPMSECDPDCCTRVLSRSTGWRRIAELKPEARPASRWKVEDGFLGFGEDVVRAAERRSGAEVEYSCNTTDALRVITSAT